MLFRKRKNILIYLALIFGAFGLASGQNACKYINYMENVETSAYKLENNVKRANNISSPMYTLELEVDNTISQIIVLDIYTETNDNGGVLEYEAINSGDIDLSSEYTNRYISYLLFNYSANTYNFGVIQWSNSDFKLKENISYTNDTIGAIDTIKLNYMYFGNYKITTRFINYNSILSESQIKSNINSLSYNNNFIDTQQLNTRINTLTAQVDTLTAQVDTLTAQVDTLTAQNESLQNSLRSLQSQNINLREQVQSLTNQVETLRNQNDTLLERNQELEEENSQQAESIRQQANRIDSLVIDLSNANRQLESAQRQIEELQSELAQNLPNNIIDWCKIFARGFVDIFNIEMLPNFKVGYLIVAPLLIGIISLFFKLIRGA